MKNKEWTDGNYYCPIHLAVKKEVVINKKNADTAKKNLEFLRKVIEVAPERKEN